jgi:hypothetical protein
VPLALRIGKLIAGFEGIGVTRAQLEAKIGRKADDFLPEDVANLGVTFNSIKRGEVTRDDEFPPLAAQATLPANATAFERAAAGAAPKPAKAAQAPAKAESPPPAEDAPAPAQAAASAPAPAKPKPYRICQPGKKDMHAPDGVEWCKWWHDTTAALRAESKGISLRALVDANANAWADMTQMGGDYAQDVTEIRDVTAAALRAMGVP